jgi:hypothetical protein
VAHETNTFFDYFKRSFYRNETKDADSLRRDLRDLRPRDMIDLQSFTWVQGSDQYT